MDTPRSKGIDSPLCKICNHRHRFADPHIFAGKAIAVAPTKKELQKMADDASARIKKPAKDGTKRGRKPTGFDKKAHDRQKSAERRAAKKAAKP